MWAENRGHDQEFAQRPHQGLDWLRFITPYYYADAARIFDGEALAGPVLAGWARCPACGGTGGRISCKAAAD